MPWILFLNDMRQGHIETLQPVCQAESMEVLKAFLQEERCGEYVDEDKQWGRRWGKSFRKDGPLEWFNQPWDFDEHRHFQQIPPSINVLGCIEYSNPVCLLPTVENLKASFPVYTRLERIKNDES